MRRPGLLSLAAANLVFAFSASSQNVPTKTFSKPEIQFEEPFTQIGGVRELRDGRVIVSDPRDKTLQIIDLKSGKAEKIGREGSGPGEYSMPLAVTPLPNDSSAVYDPLNQRFLFVLPNGKPGGFYSMVTDGSPTRMMIGGLSGFDRAGRVYFQGPSFRMTDEGPQTADSAAITRLDLRTKKTDTVAFVKVPPANTQVSGGRGNVQIRVGGGNPFSPQDAWIPMADGRVAIVSAADYRVTYVGANGARTAGSPIPYEKVKVTEADKQEVRDQFKRSAPIAITRSVGPGGAQTRAAAPGNIQMPEPTDWPEFKAPFARQGLFATPNGELWVRKSLPAGQAPLFDVIDASGKVVGRVALPKDTRIVGFGNGTLYLAKFDEDDLQYLQRYRM
jgi:hypothetical protein